MFILHISVYLTPSSGRTYLFHPQKTCFYAAIVYGTVTASQSIKDTSLLS